jgi:hypothetical protein
MAEETTPQSTTPASSQSPAPAAQSSPPASAAAPKPAPPVAAAPPPAATPAGDAAPAEVKVKIRKPKQRSCNEKDPKGKLCAGHLKRWYDYPKEFESKIGKDAEIYRCEFCKTLYKPDPEQMPHSFTLRY